MGAFALPISNALTSTAVESASVGAGAGASTGVIAGLASNPVTIIAGAGLAVFQLVKGIFSAHHQKAVATEAAALNEAVPAVEKSWVGILDYVNSGSVGPDQAKQALDSTLPEYESLVYDQYKVKRKSGNGPDYIEGVLRADLAKVEAQLSSGPGTVHIESIPSHAGFQGASALDLSFTPAAAANPITTAADSAVSNVANAAGVPKWAVIAVAILILLMLVKR
jgi:hypothetical protein